MALLSSSVNPIPVSDPGRAETPEPLTMPTHHSYSLGMYARARSYFRGTILLAKNGLADEALALGRSLLEAWSLGVRQVSVGQPKTTDYDRS